MQQDPIGEADGANLYQAEQSSPTDLLDPLGLQTLEYNPEKYGTGDSGVVLLPQIVGEQPDPGGDEVELFSSVTVDGIKWRPPAVVDPTHVHIPRADTAGPGVPVGIDLGRHSHSADGRLKWFPEHNVVLDTKTGRYERAPGHWPGEFRNQLRSKKAAIRARWAIGLGILAIISIASTSDADARGVVKDVEKIEPAMRQGKYGSPETEGIAGGLANKLSRIFGIDETIAYSIISQYFDEVDQPTDD
jgi:hypothetical protein